MKKLLLALLGTAAIASGAFAGTETYSGKEMKQVAPLPCPAWYADREFNVGIWGTYVFTANEWRNDRYIEADHAWGGGIDLKYFFIVTSVLDSKAGRWMPDARLTMFASDRFSRDFRLSIRGTRTARSASALATLTFRYPIPCSRFAPYAFVGGGGIFGGGERTRLLTDGFLALSRLSKPIPSQS